jgi:hypothetical protein
MDIRGIIHEEIQKDLLIENKLTDLVSKFNMGEIKRLLKEKMGIDETSTKMDVAKKLLKYYYTLNLKLLKYELGAVLGGFIFYFLSMVLDVMGVAPFVTNAPNYEPTMPHFILWGAGALLNVLRMVLKNIREELDGFKDSNEEDWEWAEGGEIDPFMSYMKDGKYWCVGIIINNEEEDRLTQKGFFSLGYRWYLNKQLFRDVVEEENLEYPYTLWVDDTKMIMYNQDIGEDGIDDDEIILDNPFV